MNIQEAREAAFKECKMPNRYTTDVMNDPVALKEVEAEWAAYFARHKAILEQFPYSEDEKSRRGVKAE